MQITSGPAGSRESFVLDLAASKLASQIKNPKGLEGFEIVKINGLPKATWRFGILLALLRKENKARMTFSVPLLFQWHISYIQVT